MDIPAKVIERLQASADPVQEYDDWLDSRGVSEFDAPSLCELFDCCQAEECQLQPQKVAMCAVCGETVLALDGRLPEGWTWDCRCNESDWAWCPKCDPSHSHG